MQWTLKRFQINRTTTNDRFKRYSSCSTRPALLAAHKTTGRCAPATDYVRRFLVPFMTVSFQSTMASLILVLLEHLGASRMLLWPSKGHLGPSWVNLGQYWRHIGTILGVLGALLGLAEEAARHPRRYRLSALRSWFPSPFGTEVLGTCLSDYQDVSMAGA